MRLDINLKMNNDCNFQAYDTSEYTEANSADLLQHVFLEFMVLLPYSPTIQLLPIKASKKITRFTNTSNNITLDRRYLYSLQNDGRYLYSKYGLMTINHSGIYDGQTYNIKNKVFYDNDKIYFGIENTTTPIFDNTNSKEIVNWYDLRQYVAYGINFFFDKEIISICKLEKCLINLQKQAIFDGLKNCDYNSCKKNDSIKLQRDFLFTSVYVLQYIISSGNFLEAQRIIESLSSCGSLCDDSNSGGCNCG